MNKSFPLRSGAPAYPCHWEAGPTRPARHDAYQVRHELQERGYYSIRFVGARPPHFRVKACRGGERFVLHVNFYGRITERDAIGPCHRHWWSWRHDSDDYRWWRRWSADAPHSHRERAATLARAHPARCIKASDNDGA